ncbi:HEPN-associated N-terminal domain-containing protein [Sporosarcina ureae]|uniref:HEPN-associated N-terminal domain-containing protein n=1 Tax=Sporosarcina ureae TaxID=1571 RepID=UPI0009DC7AB1|nr:HEPN-associated N-terminal domain-containing protein [Sporosarcina ureae]ARF17482.1 hypothetical protein SporoP17a_09450 [Sporosarcina ureae]
MGYHKNLLIKENELGFSTLGNKFVCSECVSDIYIQRYIEENASADKCDYCGAEDEDTLAADIDLIMEFIMTGIKYEWGNPDDEGVGYDSGEGGYLGVEIYDGWDFTENVLYGEVGINPDSLFEDIRSALMDTMWCKVDPYGSTEDEELFYTWNDFSEQVKHSIRYLFLNSSYRLDDEKKRAVPHEILDIIASFVEELNLLKKVSSSKFFRARISSEGELFHRAKEIGTPAKEYAKSSNRMSPAGIPMFYGADSKETALLEVEYRPGKNVVASIGEFVNNEKLILLDLTSLPSLPSIFDEDERKKRSVVKFFYNFLNDFTKPVAKDGREHVDYVPTQIVTEYFRHVFKYNNTNINGIVYPSSLNEKKAYVLFFENSDCHDRQCNVGLTLKKVCHLSG